MSLFRVREWWGIKCGVGEEFDRGSLCVGDVDNERTGGDKIVVGSLSGMLRIYKPQKNAYFPTDLLLEKQLEAPILQVEIGKFIPNSKDNALGVLMPRKFAVYTIIKEGTNNGDFLGNDPKESTSNQIEGYSVHLYYEHPLQRLAFNFCYGPFGGAFGKDFVCIQSFDGQLSFYEQDHFTFQRFLSTSLIPGPICYSKSIDCFVTYNSSMEVEAYKYQMLAASSGSNQKEQVNGKKVKATWTVNVGEEVYDIFVGRYSQNVSSGQTEVIVVGEHTLFTIKENGELSSQMRLDYFPAAAELYRTGNDSTQKQKLLLATHNKTLMVYKDPKLIWAAGTSTIPVSVKIGTFAGIKGMIVLLDDEGNLTVNYLGTGAISNPVPTLEAKDVDYEQLEEETKRLQQIIRRTKRNQKDEMVERLIIRAQIPNSVDPESFSANAEHKRVTIKLYLSFTGEDSILENLMLNINVEKPFYVTQPTIYIETLKGGSQITPVIMPITVYGGNGCTPRTLEASITAIYHDPTSQQPKTAFCNFLLPFGLCGSIIPAKKITTHKVTLETNRLPLPMLSLFEDLISHDDIETKNLVSDNILTFQFSNGLDVTVLISKNAGRYRIQSSSFETLFIMSKELIRRLKDCSQVMQKEETTPLKIEFTENIPFYSYFDIIDEHFKNRKGLKVYYEQLDNLAHQFRSIQKRLLIRYKDKNPTSINSLDTLFENTYNEILNTSLKIDKTQSSLKILSHSLSCSTSLILLLIQLNIGLSDNEMEVLENYITPVVNDDIPGWEETVDSALAFLLSTTLTKNPKDKPIEEPEELQNTTKLKKRFALVFDRLHNFKLLPAEKEQQQVKEKKK
ncbi:hypothetical protein ABK040_001972 [Willaertia magna]